MLALAMPVLRRAPLSRGRSINRETNSENHGWPSFVLVNDRLGEIDRFSWEKKTGQYGMAAYKQNKWRRHTCVPECDKSPVPERSH